MGMRPVRPSLTAVGLLLLVGTVSAKESELAALADRQAALDGVAMNLTRLWAQGSADLIGEALVATGIRLRLGHEDHPSLSRRQAVASLKSYLSEHRTGTISLEQAAEVGGAPPRGYAEIRWDAMEEGASQSFRSTVYVGFVQEDEAWRVFEIRVLR